MKKYRVIKLDKRHTCHEHFKYYVEPLHPVKGYNLILYHEFRQWCWATFGASMEREFIVTNEFKWCWYTHHNVLRIYFQTEKELNWFKITWPTT